ncbi:DUF4190 domain-containing protein [Gemmata sp. JC673]|uniref:DUF4190 domain-containing protein n=1 Tax=Gemmata algarum TaxID=2975278 RepID=A0ABU5EYX8_9BACT|nr:DUF4190 domain-containing protein [Gemmata algarum]MDY3559827.1 DUF4190 domain-containing protein [Gemmata algarum]
MPDIRVTCPTCNTQLEVDAAYEGEEVECGNCLQVFVATTKKSGGSTSGGQIRGATSRSRSSRDDDDDRPRRRRRDYDDDDDDDDYRPRRRSQGGNGQAVTALVLGILSLPLCCCPLVGIATSIGAITTGSLGMKKAENKGMAVAGLVLGIIGLILAIINAAAGVAMNLNQNKFR